MDAHSFSISVHDLGDSPHHLDAPLPDEWLKRMLADTDVEPTGADDGQVSVTLTKSGQDVLVQGRLDAEIAVPCARTLDPAVYRVRPEVFLILSPQKGREVSHGNERRGARRGTTDGSGPATERSAKSKKKSGDGSEERHRGGWEEDPLLTAEEAAQDTYSGDQVVLDDFFREFILLEVPMVPLREDLRGQDNEANSALPQGPEGSGASSRSAAEQPVDPRLSPLAAIKARLEKKE